jgi:hypothetical protein
MLNATKPRFLHRQAWRRHYRLSGIINATGEDYIDSERNGNPSSCRGPASEAQ